MVITQIDGLPNSFRNLGPDDVVNALNKGKAG